MQSALGRALFGEASAWTPDVALLSRIGDLLAGGNWQRGGGKGEKPKPTKPPRIPNVDF
jgi:hypothetical protein